jgi:hypothetical protein
VNSPVGCGNPVSSSFHLLDHQLALVRLGDRGQPAHDDAFLQRLFDLDVVGRHLLPGAAVDNDGFGRAEAARGSGGVVFRLEFGLDVGDRGVELQRDAHVQDASDLGVQDVARQPVLRYAVAHHAAGRGARILDGDPVARRARW